MIPIDKNINCYGAYKHRFFFVGSLLLTSFRKLCSKQRYSQPIKLYFQKVNIHSP